MKRTQRRAHLVIWGTWLLLIPAALFFALRTPLSNAPVTPRLLYSEDTDHNELRYEVMGRGNNRVLDLYIPESFSYPALVVQAIGPEGASMGTLGKLDGPGMYRFDLPHDATEAWLYDTLQGKAILQITL